MNDFPQIRVESRSYRKPTTSGLSDAVKTLIVIGITFAIAVLIVVGRMADQRMHKTTQQPSVVSEQGSKADSGMHLELYHIIQPGEDLSRVEYILGGRGTELSRVAVPGTPTTVIYSWSDKGASVNVTFQDGEVVSKAQFGL